MEKFVGTAKSNEFAVTYNLVLCSDGPTPSTANIACAFAITASLGCSSMEVIVIHKHAHSIASTEFCLRAKSCSALWISLIWLRAKCALTFSAFCASMRCLHISVSSAILALVL